MTDGAAERISAARWYTALWRRAPRELVAVAIGFPVTFAGFGITLLVFASALGLLGVLVGALLVPVALYLGRAFGVVERWRIGFAGQRPVGEPAWSRPASAVPPAGYSLYGPVLDGHYWLYLLHTLVVGPLLSLIALVVVGAWFSAGIGTLVVGVIGLASGDATPLRAPAEWFVEEVYQLIGDQSAPEPVVIIVGVLTTLLFIGTLPFVSRGAAIVTAVVGRGMLGPWRSDALQLEVADLSASRGAAVVAEDRALRRLERDIHDGPQQRLIRIQMDLASAERRIDSNPGSAKQLVAEAREHVRTALDELRALSRGVAPPILQDRGLVAAVHSLAEMSTVPVAVEAAEMPFETLPSEVERSAYFVVAELLTNVAKHSGASSARVHLAIRAGSPSWLDLWVIDDGRGGVAAVPGHGLDGLADRVQGLRGLLVVDSPAGGPSVVGVHIPYSPSVPEAQR
ncbi:sensor domain-containing protein [Microbacteriaceae bacterium VKM Ac-2854]|nr:sensor domain-containing protein [Microbacteriaceae bacterium VKM Ac-2854]